MNWPFWSRRRPAQSESDHENCDGIELLLSLYADGMAAPEESRRVASHLATCADCRESLAWMQATHRALASRPVVAPPANLQARIAEAIAASSAAPIRLAPTRLASTRTFTLRPVYAAAASLTVLGIVLSASWLLHPTPSTLTVHPMTPPIVAVNLKPVLKTPASHDHIVVAQGNPLPRVTVHPTVHPEERVAIAVVPTAKRSSVSSQPERDSQVALATKTSSLRAVAKAVMYAPPKSALFASTQSGPTEHKQPLAPPPIVAPKTNPPLLEATNLPKTAPSVPVNIGPATVTTQVETPQVRVADAMDSVRAAAAHLRTAGFTNTLQTINHTALNAHGFDAGKTPTIPLAYGDIP